MYLYKSLYGRNATTYLKLYDMHFKEPLFLKDEHLALHSNSEDKNIAFLTDCLTSLASDPYDK